MEIDEITQLKKKKIIGLDLKKWDSTICCIQETHYIYTYIWMKKGLKSIIQPSNLPLLKTLESDEQANLWIKEKGNNKIKAEINQIENRN